VISVTLKIGQGLITIHALDLCLVVLKKDVYHSMKFNFTKALVYNLFSSLTRNNQSVRDGQTNMQTDKWTTAS
jgi:hypothetical protein